MNPTIVTRSGRYFDFLDPKPEMICIEDIAHALAHLCRFTGHTDRFYSVGQHSVHVSELMPPNLQLAGLLHDATEAYVGDVARPLKVLLPQYAEIEARVWHVIALKFGLPKDLPPQIKDADNKMLMTEKRDLLSGGSVRGYLEKNTRDEWAWAAEIEPVPWKISAWPSWMARKVFLDTFHSL